MEPKNVILVFRARENIECLTLFLQHHIDYCDCFVALLDRCEPECYQIIRNHSKCAYVIERVKGGYDRFHDHDLLSAAVDSLEHKWMLYLDCDEWLHPYILREQIPNTAMRIAFRLVTLYPDSKHYISGGTHPYARHGTTQARLFQRLKYYGHSMWLPRERGNYLKVPCHIADTLLYHYGRMDKARREDRYELYCQENPEQYKGDLKERYRSIIDYSDAEVSEVDPQRVGTRQELKK